MTKSAAAIFLLASTPGFPPTSGDPEMLLKHRVVLLAVAVEDRSATETIAKLLFLEHESANAPVYLVVDSPGGSLVGALAVADAMRDLKPPVQTICRGKADGAAAFLVASGAHGCRLAGQGCEMRLAALGSQSQGGKARQEIVRRLCAATGQPLERVEDAIAGGNVLLPEAARAFGLVDGVQTQGER